MLTLLVMMFVMASGFAMAGECEHGFKVYGKLHTSINYLSDSEDSIIGLSSNTSRFGIRGSQELNETFTFIWQFENYINIAQFGANTLATRNSYIGVKGNFGKFFAGIYDTPFKLLGRKVTFFKDQIGDHRQATYGWDQRLQDVVVYATPDFDGFGAIVAYQMDQNAIGDESVNVAGEAVSFTKNAISAMAHYSLEDIFFGVAVEQWSDGNFGPYTDGAGVLQDPESALGIRAAARYSGEQFAVSGFFQTLSNVMGEKDAKSNTMGGEVLFKAAPKWNVKGSFYMFDPCTDIDDDETNFLAFGVDHVVSKAVFFYLQYAMAMNGDATAMGLGGNGFGGSVMASAAGESPMGVSFGAVKKW